MKIILLALLYANCAITTLALLNYNSSTSFTTPRLSPANHDAGEPLFLTPFIDDGKVIEAQNRSRVTSFFDEDIESHAGFLTVNKTSKSHLYFWFIRKTTIDYTSAPLILWLQGGPGCSSLFGLFAENGPVEVTNKGTLKKRIHAWTNHYHMLYIDQPVGTGFSFTENYGFVNSEEEVGGHLYEALIQFYKLFPNFKEHPLYIAGESYGGKYVPAIGHTIITAANNRQSNVFNIPLEGLMIGNGFSDPENMLEYATFLHGIGMIDKSERQQLSRIQNRIKYSIQSENWRQASAQFFDLMDDIITKTNWTNLYDYTRKGSADEYYSDFITKDRIRKSLHVGGVEYSTCSAQIFQHMYWDFLQSARSSIEELLEYYPILFYNGQFDIICAHLLTQNYLDKLHWSGATKYGMAKKKTWRVGENVAGYYKSADNLVYATVRNAGHMVPTDQPENALNLIDMFIQKKLRDNSTRLN